MNLFVSVVIHEWDVGTLEPALRALSDGLDAAAEVGELESAELWLSYNGPAALDVAAAEYLLQAVSTWPTHLLSNQPNYGYGGTNNKVLRDHIFAERRDACAESAILVLNPDVVVERLAITEALRRLKQDPLCGLVCPRILDWTGHSDTFGHKRYPSLSVLAARLVSPLMKLPAVHSLNLRYEYRDLPLDQLQDDIALCSGCFMMARFQYWFNLDGFEDEFFMYFEDFDLAARGREQGWHNVYDPAVRIRHAGGGAGRKSWQHRLWFIRSAMKFFHRHGWRIWRV
ncbi:glycosyltransferase family 2 protein [Marinobacter sp. M216]|uniref:Glycosyltransferase family 2 protein n=1 Tax=Marinobacter albus TaxID=3030833 RepID=A0ABT7HBK1_9GAMM|nr:MULTISPECIES: glycosyltransferase family 2 protein [unclassified Marinobacter]MBW7470477.1 glycosyltransferase family 2 protein [Marinobacter sp. F4218]MDK9557255.1 glycosyltransferase family 2 protein [Marinobacter sp. M216]